MKKAIAAAKKKRYSPREGFFFLSFFFSGDVWFCFVFWLCGKNGAQVVLGEGADKVKRADARKYRSELSFTFLLPK